MDTGGLLGPKYSYADELPSPSELGIGRDGSFGGITKAVAGINYYVDAIGFGESTMMSKMLGTQTPLGIRYFLKTGAKCSNGQDMYEYVDTVPHGLPGRLGKEIQNTLGVGFRGMAPGIVEDAAGALDPRPMFNAVIGSGYVKCKNVTLPVGDMKNSLKSRYDSSNVWITDNTQTVGGAPHQTRWVFDKYISQDDYDNEYPKEGFVGGKRSKLAAGILFAILFFGITSFKMK